MTNQMTSNPNLKNERTTFGKICKYSWIGFNILLFIMVLYSILIVINGFVNGSYISAGEVDPTLGIGLAFVVVFFVGFFAVGNVILGLMTFLARPKKFSRTH